MEERNTGRPTVRPHFSPQLVFLLFSKRIIFFWMRLMYCAQYFVNSTLAPVLLIRGRLKSVADVLKGVRNNGFAQSRWEALLRVLGCCLSSWSLWPHFFPFTLEMSGFP